MDEGLHKEVLRPEYSIDNGDMKNVSGLSTILVATIQEAKDRISQIEYIFCSQLFPNLKSNSKTLQGIYIKARKAAEDEWKEKEKGLLFQIEQLQRENQQAFQENYALKQEKEKIVNTESRDSEIRSNEKLLKEHEEKNNLLLRKQRILELENEELRQELTKKSKEVDGGMEMHNRLLHLVETKASLLLDKENKLKEHEENITRLLTKLRKLEEGADELQMELREKNEELDKEKGLKENLWRKTEAQESNLENYEQRVVDYEKEKEILATKLGHLEKTVHCFQDELKRKFNEVEELDNEKKLLLAELQDSSKKVHKLQMQLKEKNNESTEEMELHGKLLQPIKLKESELLSEKKKRKDLIDSYKSLKSQYNFLLEKFGLTAESKLCQNKVDENDSLMSNQNLLISPDVKNKVQGLSTVCEITKQIDCKGTSIQKENPNSPANGNSGSLIGSKRPGPRWRETRSKQNRVGPDPHDDFLDTPLENVRENLRKGKNEEIHNLLPGPLPMEMAVDSSDDETQDISVDLGQEKQQFLPPKPGTKDYKFVEPVRKKAERENLKGVECKQCKKFYDAVIPNGAADGNQQNLRCEHHEGVSRHRYRYAPPLTPEGFWNIGFESEM